MKTIISLPMVLLFATLAVAQQQQAIEKGATKPKPVALNSGVATLAPANTKISFVGEHEGSKPDPRKGGFAKFSGKVQVKEDGSLQAVAFDIDTASLFSEIPKLTGHLKSPDFFAVREHPKAAFKSTRIVEAKKPGHVNVTGEFSLLGKTREITIPTAVSVTRDGVTLLSNFSFDRTQFGMTYGKGKVKKNVAISVVVGEPTATKRK